MTGLTGQLQIGHELHLHGNHTRSLTLLTTTAIGIKREILGGKAHLLGQGLFGIQLTDGIVGLDIGGWITARTLSNRILINHLHMLHPPPVAFQRDIFSRLVGHFIEVPFEGRVEDAFYQR